MMKNKLNKEYFYGVDMKLTNVIIWILIIFNLFFPKGGIKINDIPITIGMVFLISVLIYQFIKNTINGKIIYVSKKRCFILISWMPFQIIVILSIFFNGIDNIGVLCSMIFNFIFLPYFFIWASGEAFEKLNKRFLFKWFRYGVIFISIFGIINFFYKYITGNFIEIPFFTVNADDIGMIEEKHINRGGIFKLISTYQNGNIYGVCVLMILPLFCYLEKNTVLQWIVKISILLTLSRTAWVGLILYEFMRVIFISFSIKRIKKLIIIYGLIVGAILYLLNFINADIIFLLDENLGGRADKINSIIWNFLPDKPLNSIQEVVYMGIIDNFGMIGLITFIIAILSPIVIYFRYKLFNDIIKKYIICGYIIYLIVAMSDGAILLIPVMIFYWFIILLLTCDSLKI